MNRKQEQSNSIPFPSLEDKDDWEVEEVKEKKKFKGEDQDLILIIFALENGQA